MSFCPPQTQGWRVSYGLGPIPPPIDLHFWDFFPLPSRSSLGTKNIVRPLTGKLILQILTFSRQTTMLLKEILKLGQGDRPVSSSVPGSVVVFDEAFMNVISQTLKQEVQYLLKMRAFLEFMKLFNGCRIKLGPQRFVLGSNKITLKTLKY